MRTSSVTGGLQPIVYVDTSEVRIGRKELKAAMFYLSEFVEANEPQLLAYNVYLSDHRSRITVLHINPDSASLEFHMKVAGPKFPPIDLPWLPVSFLRKSRTHRWSPPRASASSPATRSRRSHLPILARIPEKVQRGPSTLPP